MGYEEQILRTLSNMQDRQADTAGEIGGIKSDVRQIKLNTDKNTEQISEIRRSSNTGLVKKLLPYIFAAIVGAAIGGGALFEAMSK
jgi:hypothetical protein